MAAECWSCPCLNVQIQVRPCEDQDEELVSVLTPQEKASTTSGKRPQVYKLAGSDRPIIVTHDYLTTISSPENKKEYSTLRCTNCSTLALAFRTPENSKISQQLPLSGKIALSEKLIPSKSFDSLKQEPSYSLTYEILMETMNAPAPHLNLSLYTTSPTTDIPTFSLESTPTLQRTISEPRSRDVSGSYSNNPILLSLNDRLSQAVKNIKSKTEKDIAQLRKTSEMFAKRAKDEADILAQRAGIVRGFPSPLSPTRTATSSPALRPILSPRRTQEPSLIPTLPPDLDPNSNLDLAASLQITAGLKKMEEAAAQRAEELQKEAAERAKAEEQAKMTEEKEGEDAPVSGKKVTFLVPEEAGEAEQQLGVSPGQSSLASTSTMQDQAEDTMFNLDEELEEEHAQDLEVETPDDVTDLPNSLSPSANEFESLEEAYERTKPTNIKSSLSAANSIQAEKLRQLLGSDAPSHRNPSKKDRDGRQTPLNGIFESSGSPISPNTSTTSFESKQTEARSVPISMAMRRRTELPDLEQKTSVPDREAFFVPPLRTGARRSPVPRKRASAHRSDIAQQLKDATEYAANMSLSKGNGFANGSKTPNIDMEKPEPTILSSEELFSPPSNITSSFRGPSSLSAALSRQKEIKQEAVVEHLDRVKEGFEISLDLDLQEPTMEEGEEPDSFVPPHKWKALTRGSESLLSTSVRDLRD